MLSAYGQENPANGVIYKLRSKNRQLVNHVTNRIVAYRNRKLGASITAPKERARENRPESVDHLLHVDPLSVSVGYGLLPLIDRHQGEAFLGKVRSIRRQFATDFGIIIPPIHIREDYNLPPSAYEIRLRGARADGAELMVDHYLAMDLGKVTEEIEGIDTVVPLSRVEAKWIPQGVAGYRATVAGYKVVDSETVMATHLTEVLKKHLAELVGRQETKDLLDSLSKTCPAAVEELWPNLLPLGTIRKVLQNLLREQIPTKDLLTIVETLADFAPITKDPDPLTKYVRDKLSTDTLMQNCVNV